MRSSLFTICLIVGVCSFGQSFDYYDSLDIRAVDYGDRIDPTGWRSLWEVKGQIKKGELSEAQENLMVVFNEPGLVAFHHNLRGELALRYSNFDEAQAQFEKALNQTTNQRIKALVLSNLGLFYLANSNQDKARDYFNQAFRLKTKEYGENSLHVAAAYNNLGLVYTERDSKKAVDYFKMAGVIYQKELKEANYFEGIKNTNLALAFQNVAALDSALFYANKAMSFNSKKFGADQSATIFSKSLIGQIYLANHNYEFADLFLEECVESLNQNEERNYGEIARVYNVMALSSTEQERFGQALLFLHQSREANLPDHPRDLIFDGAKEVENCFNADALLQTYYELGALYEQEYFHKTLAKWDLKESLSYYRKASAIVDYLRQQRVSAADKLRLASIAKQIYTQALGVCYELNNTSLNKMNGLDDAYFFMEKSKASVLQDAISEAKAKSFAGLPKELLVEEQSIKSRIAFLSNKLSREGLNEEETTNLFNLKRELEQFQKRILADYPKYHQLKSVSVTHSLKVLQVSLKNDELLLDYFMGNNGFIYRLEVSSNKVRLDREGIPEKFVNKVKGFRNTITYKAEGAFVKTSRELGRLLLPKIGSRISQVIILADGELGMIPFSALITSNKGEGYGEYQYLVRQASIKYHLSGNLFVETRTKEKSTEMNAGVFAPIEYPACGLKTLAGANEEQNAIMPYLAAYEVNTYLKDKATESTFKSTCGNYSLLHLPTHGVVDQNKPGLSRVYLTPDDQNDGILYVGEIYSLKLNANLVTLSACETGLGKLAKGEGVIGLSRALVYAGADNLVVSFWTVSDDATASLMTSFYKSRQQSGGVAMPLRKAQLELINSKDFAAPYYWASFFQIGED